MSNRKFMTMEKSRKTEKYCRTPLFCIFLLIVVLCLVSLTEAGIIAKTTKNVMTESYWLLSITYCFTIL